MLPIGIQRAVDFKIADVSGNPAPGRTLTDWQAAPNHVIFLRNEAPCSDLLTVKDYGDGRYTVTYTPSSAGHDYLEIRDDVTDINVIDTEDIIPLDWAVGSSAGLVTLNQDYGGAGALLVTIEQPQTYTLYLFRSEDWTQGLQTPASAVGITGLDAGGRWLNSVEVIPGYYNIVLMKPATVTIMQYNLQAH